MEKDTSTEEQQLPAPLPETASPSSSNAASKEGSKDLEAGTERLQLQRTTTGPPYSIFSPQTKIFILIAVSISSLISPFGATTFYPALIPLANDLGVTPSLINLSLTTYMIAQGIAPALIAGMSDQSGRRLSFIICFVIFGAANVGLALQTNYAALLVLRMVQAFGCSAAIALTTAVVADISTSAERGKNMGYATAGLLFGPAFGPTIGGLFAQYLGWRWTFWFLVIFSGFLLVVFTFFFPETCRNVVGNGSIPARGVSQSILGYLQQRRHAREEKDLPEEERSVQAPVKKKGPSFPNPLETLKILGDKESLIVLLYNGAFFTGMIGFATPAIPDLYQAAWGLDTLDVGLCYIAMGMGSLTSALTMGHVVDWNFRRHARRLGITINKGKQQDLSNFPIEAVRMQVVIAGHIIGTLAFIVFGWTIDYRTSLAGPEIALYFIGFGVSTSFNISNTLLVDLHRGQPATATAAVNFVRCLMCAGAAAAIIPMCHAMGTGWAFTFIALLYVVLMPVIWLLMTKGQKWRNEKAAKRNERERAREEREHAEDVEGQSTRSSQDKEKGEHAVN